MGRSEVGKVGRGGCFVKFAVKVFAQHLAKIAAGVCPASELGWQQTITAHAVAPYSGRRQTESPHAVVLRPERCVADASGAQHVFIRALSKCCNSIKTDLIFGFRIPKLV